MGNDKTKIPHIQKIYSLVKTLPAFTMEDLSPIEQDKTYLKILLSRYAQKGKLIRLKKGMYTTQAYIDTVEKTQRIDTYKTFLANLLYEPSYLSLEYMLFNYHLLTDMPIQFTSMSTRKTTIFQNPLGQYRYHSITDALFVGFTKHVSGGFTIQQATKAKALFDFLYLRQHLLFDTNAIDELRLNTDLLTVEDKKEFWDWITQSESQRLRAVGTYIIEQ